MVRSELPGVQGAYQGKLSLCEGGGGGGAGAGVGGAGDGSPLAAVSKEGKSVSLNFRNA